MKNKTEKIAKEIIKKYAKTFKDLGDYDTAPNKERYLEDNE